MNLVHEKYCMAQSNNCFYLLEACEAIEKIIGEYESKVSLIYLDPPFMTGQDFKMRTDLGKLKSYSDKIKGDQYYEYMKRVLLGCHKLLKPDGSLFLHIDFRTCSEFRLILDEIFGYDNFANEIIWHYNSGGRSKLHFSRKHDNILFYKKSKKSYFNIDSIGIRRGTQRRNHMKKISDENGKTFFTIKSNGKTYTYSEDSLMYPSDVWTDISHLQQKDPQRTGYPTQKPEALLERIIKSASKEGDIIADFFAGSGTTFAVAHKLKRRFIGSDQSPLALNIIRRRLLEANCHDFEIFHSGNKYDAYAIISCLDSLDGILASIISYNSPNGASMKDVDFFGGGYFDAVSGILNIESFSTSKSPMPLTLNSSSSNAVIVTDCFGGISVNYL